MATSLNAYAHETITVSTTALPLTASVYNLGGGEAGPQMALLTTATDSCRFWLNGAAPTSTVGHVLTAGSTITLYGNSIQTFRVIRSGSADVPLSCTYFRQVGVGI